MPFRRSLILTKLVHALRAYRTEARRHSLIKKYALKYYPTDNWARSESRAFELLRRAERASPWLSMPIYPAGGAAGPLLFYLLLRVLSELPIKTVLELGAGQSTLMLDAWTDATNGNVVTFEHNGWWADAIQSRLTSARVEVRHLPLTKCSTSVGEVEWYSLPPDLGLPTDGFDLILVDGPVGASRYSRVGITEYIPRWAASEWLLLWDDLDRLPDMKSFSHLLEKLRRQEVKHDHVLLDGSRTIGLIHTPDFRKARFLW